MPNGTCALGAQVTGTLDHYSSDDDCGMGWIILIIVKCLYIQRTRSAFLILSSDSLRTTWLPCHPLKKISYLLGPKNWYYCKLNTKFNCLLNYIAGEFIASLWSSLKEYWEQTFPCSWSHRENIQSLSTVLPVGSFVDVLYQTEDTTSYS